ncbi:MAG: hypothetical protein KKB57_09320 [Proteobacteria bacterium]|nr:hypothetical protein [Pseudomonadota bacterium]MBU2467301.1 hypothetical protein [Pseudomonadota bacterium]MBU2517771.1 hypothetical protein [Pseudomonadota bacterium]
MRAIAAIGACILLVASLALGAGCTTVSTADAPTPAPGPVVKAGLRAVMPPVIDKRSWPTEDPGVADPNIHIFAPGITGQLRQGLLASGLFAALPAPDQPAAAGINDQLTVTIGEFTLSVLGNNPWSAGAYILDGLILPVFGVVAVATKGEVDTGAYLLPSTRVGATLGAEVAWGEKGAKKPIISRGYRVTVELGAVSQREIMANMGGISSEDGVKIGKAQGMKALRELSLAISRDPNWLYLNSYVRLARARQVIEASTDPEARLRAAQGLVGLLAPLPYTPAEAKVLRDGLVTADLRADQVNALRAGYLGLANAKALPAGQKLTQEQAQKLFDDPAVERAQSQGEVVNQTLGLVMSALSPVAPKAVALAAPVETKVEIPTLTRPTMPDPEEGFPGQKKAAPPAPVAKAPAAPAKPVALSPQAQGMRDQLIDQLAAALKGYPRLQGVFVQQADIAVGPLWPLAKQVLIKVGSPQTKSYLAKREAS